MHKKIDFCINSGQNGYFVLQLKKYLRNTKSSSVESFILALLWFNSQPEIENILSQATLLPVGYQTYISDFHYRA